MSQKIYTYFVSFVVDTDDGHGFSNTTLRLRKEIDDVHGIGFITESIQKALKVKANTVVVMYFRLLNAEESKDESN